MTIAGTILVDSSVWVEYFLGNPDVREPIRSAILEGRVVVPALCIYEVALTLERHTSYDESVLAVAFLKNLIVDDLTPDRALEAADVKREYRLAMADAVMYATTKAYGATLITLDDDFAGLAGVHHFRKHR